MFETLLEADREGLHPDAAQIYRRIGAAGVGVSLSSVYRALTTLDELGVLRRHQLGTRSVYEPTARHPHSHMVDGTSGAITDFRDEAIEDRMRQRSQASGFDLSHYTHVLFVRPAKE